jgi:hypothetical protein
LPELVPVKSSVAKDQHLSTLNPSQISGACGRLMCCLRYEHEFYVEQRRRFPKEGKLVRTIGGEEKVLSVDIFRETVTLRSAAGETRVVPLQRLHEELVGEVPPWATRTGRDPADRAADAPSADRAADDSAQDGRAAEAAEAAEAVDAAEASANDGDARNRQTSLQPGSGRKRRRGRRGGRRNRRAQGDRAAPGVPEAPTQPSAPGAPPSNGQSGPPAPGDGSNRPPA